MHAAGIEQPKPACIDSSDENLKDRWFCYLCDRPWYNCVCAHEED
jgi:hypothetical protein